MIVDRIYQIALEPSSLDAFIDFWHDTDLETKFSNLDTSYKTHLERGASFLQRAEAAGPDLSEHLQPYDNLAAFVVLASLDPTPLNAATLSGRFASSEENKDEREALQTRRDYLEAS